MTGPTTAPAGVNTRVTTTLTDLDQLRDRLEGWLRDRLGDHEVSVENLRRSTASGMSSVSVMFSTVSARGAGRRDYVLRLAPEPSAVPVFPDYDLLRQARVSNAVADTGLVPVPRVRWLEQSAEPLGRPFLVMDGAHGVAPPDNPPYVFGGPLTEATPQELARLQRDSVEILVGVHATPIAGLLPTGAPNPTGPDSLAAHLADTVVYYEWTVAADGVRVPMLEEGLARLRARPPRSSSESVLTWGDARIGNILYEDHRPTAVLDWEGATIGPPELDVAWFVFFHRMFQEMAEFYGKPGLPDFLHAAEVIDQYQRSSGRRLQDMSAHLMLSAVRAGIIFARIKQRTVHFGDAPAPDRADEYVLHHRMLRAILDDRFEWEI